MSFIFDAHLDLAMNAIEWNRDLTQPLDELRRRERDLRDKPDRGRGTVCFPEMRRGGIGLCVATQLARVEHNAYSPIFGWRSPAQAWAMTQAQLAWYRAMEGAGEMVQIRDRAGLERHLEIWGNAEPRLCETAERAEAGRQLIRRSEEGGAENIQHPASNTQHPMGELPIGYVLTLEGADSLVTLQHLERSVEEGLRAIGPAHYGPGVYANGTDASGGFNSRGRELMREISRLELILDVTHLCDECFWEALDLFHGSMWASHQNCRELVPHMRQFSDEQLRALISRGAVIGCALDAWMLIPGWVRGKTTPASSGVRLEHVVENIDRICQLAGNPRHAGIGSDLDGCFGTEQTPQDLDSIADLPKIAQLLAARGYSSDDIECICSRNFVNFLMEAWK